MKWKNEVWDIKDLKFYVQNPRSLSKHDGEHLKKSLESFDQCDPVIVNTDGTIIGGHQRVKTLKKMGRKTVDVRVPEYPLEEKQVQELNIRLNKNVGDWDYDVLANVWEFEDLLDWGFTEKELDLEPLAEEEGSGAEEKAAKCQIVIDFPCKKDLREAEIAIEELLSKYPEATHKVVM